jgi:hypothetical protein
MRMTGRPNGYAIMWFAEAAFVEKGYGLITCTLEADTMGVGSTGFISRAYRRWRSLGICRACWGGTRGNGRKGDGLEILLLG